MEYGYCSTTLIPCRAEASDKSELINQLLFGETYKVLEETEKWIRLETYQDHYQGWIDRKLHSPLSQEELEVFNKSAKVVIHQSFTGAFHKSTGTTVILSHGAIIPTPVSGKFIIGSNEYTIDEQLPLNQDLSAYSQQFLNAPYLWGGKSVFGADCSGFTQVIYRAFNKWLPRDAYQQAELGTEIQLADVQAGDLAYFGKPDGKITHVGICLADGKIIHCSGRCRIDSLDAKGIFNTETNEYSHDLRIIKRL